MIVDHIENLERILPYIKNENLIRGLKYLKETDMSSLPVGKHTVDGDNVFVSVSSYQTKQKADARPEAHVKYIDIQYIIEGEEIMGYSRLLPALEVTEDKLAEKDAIFYNVKEEETEILMKKGMFAIFFPWDVHRPNCSWKMQAQMKKAVVKVKVV